MKQMMRMFVAAFSAAVAAAAGDLTVEGDLNVTSNLAARTLSATNAALGALRVDGPAVFAGTLQGDGSAVTNLSGANLAGGSVDAGSLAPGAVTSAKIQAGSITDAHVAADAAISQSKVAGLADAVVSLNAHLAATDNPHGVTAAQIGALTNETDAAALAALAQYALTNKVTRWQDSCNSNMFWTVNGGTNLTTWKIEHPVSSKWVLTVVSNLTENGTIYLASGTYDTILPYPLEIGTYNNLWVDESGDPLRVCLMAGPTFFWKQFINDGTGTYYQFFCEDTEAQTGEAYISYVASRDGSTNIVVSYDLASITGDVWQAIASAYPSSNPSNYVSASEVNNLVASATVNLLPITGDGSQLTGITATQVGAYTVNQTDAAIASALAGFNPESGVQTNHVGNVTVSGSVAAAAFIGDGAGVTNLNLAAYVGDNLSWVGGKLHAAAGGAGYTDAQAVAAVTAADLNMNAHRVTGLAAPVADGDAVSKAYLRAVLSALPPQGDLSMGSYTNGRPAAFLLEFD